MKKLSIDSSNKFTKKFIYVLEVEVSKKNLISDEEIDQIFFETFSSFDSAEISVLFEMNLYVEEKSNIKIEINSAKENDSFLSVLELFLHYLGNVRVYHKKIEYRVVS